MIGFRVSAFFQAYLFLLLGSRCPNTPYLLDRIASSRPNFVFAAEYRLQGRISFSRPNFVFAAEFRLQGRISSSRPNFVFQGRISSSGPNFVFAAEFRLQGRISSSRPNFVFRAEFRLQGRISSSGPNFVFAAEFRLQGRISSSGPNFVFRAEFRLRGRISSSRPNIVFRTDFRVQGRISSSGPNFVFTVPQTEFRLHGIFVFMADFRLQISSSRQFELQLLGNNFVFKSFGISASGGVRNRDPLSRVNACTVRASLCCCISGGGFSDKGQVPGIISAALSGCGAGI